MPSYCYTTPDGETVERLFSMKDEIPKEIVLEDGRRATRDFVAEHGGFAHSPGNWPLLSEAMGVAESQVKEAHAYSVKIGVPTEFTPDGRAVFTCPSHRKRYARAHGFIDRNGGYSDP